MEVILLSDVEHVGLRGDVVSVARGYARNYLLPRQLAEEATPARVAELQKRDTLRARHEAKTADEAQRDRRRARRRRCCASRSRPARPARSSARSRRPTSPTSSGTRKKIRVDRRKIETDPIKRIGRYEIPIGALRGRARRGQDRGRPRGRRAAVRRGARGAGGGRARRAGGRRARAVRRARGDPRRGGRRRGGRGRSRGGRGRQTPRPSEAEAEPSPSGGPTPTPRSPTNKRLTSHTFHTPS